MAQPNAQRIQYEPIQALTSALNDDRQTLTQTGFIRVGDVLEFWDSPDGSCLETFIGFRTVTAVHPDTAIFLNTAINLTTATGTVVVRNRTIDDVSVALDRFYRNHSEMSDYKVPFNEAITGYMAGGGGSYQTVGDASFFGTGDTWAIVSDAGLAGTGTVLSVDQTLGKIEIGSNIDTSLLTNPVIINTSLTLEEALRRLSNFIDQINAPMMENLVDGDCDNTAFLLSQSIVFMSSSLFLDGVRQRRGTAGTRAALTNGASNAQLLLTSLVLGLNGNDIDFEMLDPGAPSSALSVSVTGTYADADRKVSVSLATDGSSVITSTAAQVAAAVNAHAAAKRLMQVRYGGTGAGVQAALAATPMAGGLDDGTGDYAELEIVNNNLISGTGYRWVSFHIRPLESNRMSIPPRESEELDVTFTTAI